MVTPSAVLIYILRLLPPAPAVDILSIYPVSRSEDRITPSCTWLSNTWVNTSFGTAARLANPFAERKALKAALLGANTVKSEVPAKVVLRSPAIKAALRLE